MAELRAAPGNKVLDELVALSRRSLHGEAVRQGERTFERVQQSLRTRDRQRWSRNQALAGRRVLGWGVSVGALCALGFYLWYTQAPLRYEVTGAVAMASGEIVGGEQSRLRFTDGSELILSRDARARVASLDAHGGRIELRGGEAHVFIEKRPQTRWFVHAGPYEVRITGTAFDVRWSRAEQTFDLTMRRGEVYVSGPLLEEVVRLRAGQSVRIALVSKRVWFGNAPPARDDAAPDPVKPRVTRSEKTVESIEPAIEKPTDPLAIQKRHRAIPRDREEISLDGKGPWARLLAHGDFKGVLDEVERFGVERALSTAPERELAALADAARFMRRGELAWRALLSARKRFPRGEIAADAAFLLGRIEEHGGGNRAVSWYTLYLRENPRGPYAEQALGRLMLSVYRTAGAAAARSLAADYLERHAIGTYAQAARRLLSGAAPPLGL
ncbi:MAG: FecR domain-containing protein [Deltaproteobacteria bacterium]|nr:FecR domain-containing protein [Deltaproteobacteria bacterium]